VLGMIATALIGGVFLIANLIVLGLNLKLYTEVFKEQAQQRRAGQR
jgi:hypothetical protein